MRVCICTSNQANLAKPCPTLIRYTGVQKQTKISPLPILNELNVNINIHVM